MKKLIWSRILFGIGIALLTCYLGYLIYIYNFHVYSPYASGGPDLDALITSILGLPPITICLLSSLVLRLLHKKT